MRSGAVLSAILAVALLGAPFVSTARAADAVHQIGFLSASTEGANPGTIEAFTRGLRAHGWVEGRNIHVNYRWANGRTDRLPTLAADLLRHEVELIVAALPPAVGAARAATRSTPIVMVGGPEPVTAGLVASLARPGGNVTGITFHMPEISGKWLELLKQAAPGASRVLAVGESESPGMAEYIAETQKAAALLGITVERVHVARPADIDAVLRSARAAPPDAMIVTGSPPTFARRDEILEFARQKKVPVMYSGRTFVEAGGLMSYASNAYWWYERAAYYVDAILKGASAADLPVERPAKFELVINLKAARAIGLTLPQSLLLRADEVIR